MSSVIDSDQHLYESRTLWADHIDPGLADEALAIEDDELGYPWLTWRNRRLDLADVQLPGDTVAIGRNRQRCRQQLPPEYSYDDTLPREYWDPAARATQLTSMGIDEAVLFPNFGLLWERRLSESLTALTANMAAWNRWCATVVADGGGRLHPVGPPHPPGSGMAGAPAVRALVGRRAAGHDRPGSRRRQAAVPSRARPALGIVRPSRHHPAVPRRRSTSAPRRSLLSGSR